MKPNLTDKIYVAGHKGLVGSAIVRALQSVGYTNLLLKTRSELDLLDKKAVQDFFAAQMPQYVIIAAAKVGGILANKNSPADFIYQNLEIQNHIIDSSHQSGVSKLVFLGSSCIYPKLADQPITEDALLTGPLEETNRAYAIAKIAGIVMCESYRAQYGDNFISVMPTNLYGPGDNFNLETSHVLPALIRRFDDAKNSNASSVTLWGTGSPKREFLHVDDLARAVVFLLENYNEAQTINVGTGEDVSIKDLAEMVKKIVGYEGNIDWDASKPDGTPRKLLNVSKLHTLGFKHMIALEERTRSTYKWYLSIKSN